MAIVINNNIGNFEAFLISPEGTNLGLITNIISLDNVRVQIKTEQVIGYKILFKDKYISIDKNGNLEDWPNEFCYYTDILLKLI